VLQSPKAHNPDPSFTFFFYLSSCLVLPLNSRCTPHILTRWSVKSVGALCEIWLGIWIASLKTVFSSNASICVSSWDQQDWDPSMPDQKRSLAITFITWVITFSSCCCFGIFLGLHICLTKKEVVPTLAKWKCGKMNKRESYSNLTRTSDKGRPEEFSGRTSRTLNLQARGNAAPAGCAAPDTSSSHLRCRQSGLPQAARPAPSPPDGQRAREGHAKHKQCF